MAQNDDVQERKEAVNQIRINFQNFPDKNKEQASKDLLALTKDENSEVRGCAAYALGPAFKHVTDKEQAWKELLALTKDQHSDVRRCAADALGPAFKQFTDKEQAWKELLALTKDQHSYVRNRVVYTLGRAVQHMTDKQQAWKDLLVLTKDEDGIVRWRAANALGPTFQYMTDKQQAWKDLMALTKDEHSVVRRRAANALGRAVQHMTDKQQARKDLMALTKDKDRNVRVSANYSLGKISIYRATEAESEERLKEEMDKAIEYFEKSSQESRFINPAEFCLPFYRSYNAVIFRKEEAEEEIEKNLEEAAYRRYCDRTVELLDETEDKSQGAAKLVRRGLPIIDERIKAILVEIQEKTKALCIETKDSPLEDFGKEVNKIGQNLLSVRDPIGLEKSVNILEIALSDICNRMVGIEKGEACELLEREKNEHYIEDKLPLMSLILSKVSSQIDKQKYGIREEIVISVGGTVFGTGVQHNITIPLQEIAYDDLKNDLKKIGSKDVFDLATLPPKLAEKVNQYIDKIKGRR